MRTVYEELDEAKAEIEKLRADYRMKLDFSESLKRAHNEQLTKFHEANLKVDKLSQQLNEKAEEISLLNQMFEDIKAKLKEKEDVIKHLTCVNDKLHADSKERLRSFQEENRGLALALDEANAKNMDQEQLIHSLKLEIEGLKGIELRADCKERLRSSEEENRRLALALDEASAINMDQEQLIRSLTLEIEGLKAIVSVSQNKCSEVDRKHEALQEVKRGEGVLLKLEEEKSKYENQLKWKKEQFGHLEEAHKKLRNEFQVSEKEWEKERVSLLDEISRLQTHLDSQTRISESLQSQLQMCNQALAHEESKRKYLEVQLSESKTNFERVFADYDEAKSTIESLTGQRDKEIASLRNSLGTRESIYKEMEYQVRMLKQEKQELMASLKELQEAQIREGGGSASSLTKLQNKLRGLEQVHKDCLARLKAKEADWKSQLEVVMEKLYVCSSELDNKNTMVDQLKMKAEAHDSMVLQLALHSEEAALMELVLKSELLEAKLKLADAYVNLDHNKKERNESISLFKSLEEVHKNCSAGFKTKEAEWNSQLELLEEKLKCCSSELESKNLLIDQLKLESEVHDSMIEELALLIQEATLILLVLKSGFQEAYTKLAESYANLDEKNKQSKERETHLLEQLEMMNGALTKAQSDTEEERKKVAYLSEKVESVSFIEEQQLLQHKELERIEKLLSESYACQCELKKQVLGMSIELKEVFTALRIANEELDEKICRGMEFEFQLQIWKSFAKELKTNLEKDHQMHGEVKTSLHAQLLSLKSDLKKARKTLARANEELVERFCQGNEAEFELQIWKSIAEQLKSNLEEYHQMRKEVEASLLAEVAIEVNLRQEKEGILNLLEEKDKRIEDLHGQITLLFQELEIRETRVKTPAFTKNEKLYSSRTSFQSLDCSFDDYREEEEGVKRELEGPCSAQLNAEKKCEHEKDSLHHLVEERDQRIEHLQQLVKTLEEEFESSTSSFSSKLSEMQLETNLFRKFWQKMETALFMREMEIQEKNVIIIELENDLTDLETDSEASKSEVQRLRSELEKEQSTSDLLIQKLNDEKEKIVEDVVKLSSDRQNLLDSLEGLSDRMHKLSVDDLQQMESLKNILNFDSSRLEIDFNGGPEIFDPVKENKNIYASPRTTKFEEAILDGRLPLRALNGGLCL